MNIDPIITRGIARLIEEPDELLELTRTKGAITLIDLDEYRKNLNVWNAVLAEHRVETYLAHKATTSPAILRATREAGNGIDVASLGELESALNAGFAPEKIECTGPKNNAFLSRAAETGCLISIDSLEELERLEKLGMKIRVLIRIADPPVSGRTVLARRSKFGLRRDEIESAYTIIERSHIELHGFHVHRDGLDAGMRALIAEGLLEMIIDARSRGFMPTIINLGGGISAPRIANQEQWRTLVHRFETQLLNNEHHETWGAHAYGMALTSRGTIMNRALAEKPGGTEDPLAFIGALLNTRTSHDVSLTTILSEADITLILEPGRSLLTSSGITAATVIGVKEADIPLTVCDTNILALGSRMIEPVADPILVPTTHTEPFTTFLAGTLCREDDILMQRAVRLPRRPQAGDVLIFTARGAYQHYEQSHAQLQPITTPYVLEHGELRRDE